MREQEYIYIDAEEPGFVWVYAARQSIPERVFASRLEARAYAETWARRLGCETGEN